MSSATQGDLDWAAIEPLPAGGADGEGVDAGVRDAASLTDEEILGIEPSATPDTVARRFRGGDVELAAQKTPASEDSGYSNTDRSAQTQTAAQTTEAPMPEWMASLAADPKVGAEAQQLWSEHQAFRAAFASPDEARVVADEARAIKEMFPGGARDCLE